MTTCTIAGVEVSDGDRLRVTFQTPYRRSIGGRIPLEGEVEKTVEGTADVVESILENGDPIFSVETDDGDTLTIRRASDFRRVEWDEGHRNRVRMSAETDISGWVVGKKDDRADRDENFSVAGYVPVGQEPDIEVLPAEAKA